MSLPSLKPRVFAVASRVKNTHKIFRIKSYIRAINFVPPIAATTPPIQMRRPPNSIVKRVVAVLWLLHVHHVLHHARTAGHSHGDPTKHPPTLRTYNRIDYRMHSGRTIKDIAAAPFMVLLTIYRKEGWVDDANTTSVCGGSVIAERRIVTAAHCLAKVMLSGFITYSVDAENVVIKAGTPDRNAEGAAAGDESAGMILTRGERISVHPKYGGERNENLHDIAIVVPLERLYAIHDGSGSIHGSVRPIAMPTGAQALFTDCTLSGWGRTKFGVLPQWLQQSEAQVVKAEKCNSVFGGELGAGKLCVLGKDSTADKGDSGGPLVCGATNGTGGYLTGVVSYGTTTPTNDKPVVYTSVWDERDFVLNAAAGRWRGERWRRRTTTEQGVVVWAAVVGGRLWWWWCWSFGKIQYGI